MQSRRNPLVIDLVRHVLLVYLIRRGKIRILSSTKRVASRSTGLCRSSTKPIAYNISQLRIVEAHEAGKNHQTLGQEAKTHI